MEKSSRKAGIPELVFTGLMAALVFVSSLISIDIPNIVGVTRIHLGNIFCILSGLLLGGVYGGISAGVGSMLFDLTNPLYITSAPFTLVFKWVIGFTAGKIAYSDSANGMNTKKNITGAIAGSLAYIVLYLGKNFISNMFFLRTELETALIATAQKGTASLINAVIAVIVSVPLAAALKRALSNLSLYNRLCIR